MSTFNVLRWSALGAGVVYGGYHSFSLKSQAHKEEARAAFIKKEKLIAEAKAEFAKLNKKEEPKTESTQINLEDPNLDYGAVLLSLVDKIESK